MGSVLALLPRHERPAVRAKAHRLRRRLRAGTVHRRLRAGTADRRLGRRVCLQVAAIAPHLPVDHLWPLAWHALWCYRLDDRLDAPEADQAALARLRDELAGVTAGQPVPATAGRPGGGDPLPAELARTVEELSRHDPGGEVLARFGEALRDAVAADVEQLRFARTVAAGASAPPTAERYLEVAARTVNYRSFAYALLAVGAGPLTASQLAGIDAALAHAAYAARLGNDLRSLARDHAGTALNVLRLRTAAGAPVTAGYVSDEIRRRVRAHDEALGGLTGRGAIPPAPARLLSRCLRQTVDLYRRTDLR